MPSMTAELSTRAVLRVAASVVDDAKQGGGDIDLQMRIKIVDGDEVIADTAEDGGFLATCGRFEEYVRTRFKRPAAA